MSPPKRRRHVQPRGPVPMYVIAGLPIAVLNRALSRFEARLPHAIIKGIPSPSDDGRLYPRAFIERLICSVGGFVIRRRDNGKAQPTPASITLLFVPAPDQELLLQAFDFALMVAPIAALVARDERRRQLRHDLSAVDEALDHSVAAAGAARMNLNEVERRLSYRLDNESLLLPPRNFMVQAEDLVPVFRGFRNGARPWTDRLTELGPTPLTHDDVPARIQPQQTRRPFVDSRGMAFFIAHPTAYDGAAREVEGEADVAGILSALRSLYRFGGALVPGMHHDAQRSDGSPLGGAVFHCTEKGRIRSHSDYANIYPNDFVRVADHEAVK
jgi:hypothetical protein